MGDEGWRVDGEGGCSVVGVRNRPGGSRSQHKGGGEDPDRWMERTPAASRAPPGGSRSKRPRAPPWGPCIPATDVSYAMY